MNRPIQLKVRLTEKEMEKLKKLADNLETTKSQVVRELITTAYNQGLNGIIIL